MPHSVYVSANIWAIAPDGTLHFAPSASLRWHPVSGLPSKAITLTACEQTSTVYVACADGSLHSFNSSDATLQQSSKSNLHALPRCLLAIPDETALFAGLSDGAVVRFYLPSLAFDCILGAGVEHTAAVYALEADPHYLYSAGADATVLVWALASLTGERDFSIPAGPVRSLLRVGYSLWLGLENGTVQVLEIFGDDVNAVTEVSQKSAHSGPVTALVRVGEHTIWSVEDMPASYSPHSPNQSVASNVAIWDIRDYSFTMADDLYSPLIKTVAVVDRSPLERVTIVALSRDLHAQLVVKDVTGNLNKSSTAESSMRASHPQQGPDYQSLRHYANELEQRLLNAQQQLQYYSSTPHPIESSEASSANKFIASPRSVNDPSDSVAEDPYLPMGIGSLQPAAISGDNVENDINVSDAMALPNSIADSLQSTLTTIADLLVNLLTDEVLATDSDPTATQNDALRRTVADLTKQLHVGRQLVGCCVSSTGEAEFEASTIAAIGNADNYSIMSKPALEGLRKKLDDAVSHAESLLKDLQTVTDERDLLREDLQQTQAQTETTLASLEGIIRERESEVSSRDVTIAQLRAEVEERGTALETEKRERVQMEQSIVDETVRVAEVARCATIEYENQLKACHDKVRSKDYEIQSCLDKNRGLQSVIEDLRRGNSNLEERCKKIERELADATATVESARKDLAANLAAKEKQHCEALQAIKLEREDELVALRKELASLRAEYEEHREEAQSKCDALRSECEEIRQSKTTELTLLRDRTNLQIEGLGAELDSVKKSEKSAQTRVVELESENSALVTLKDREVRELQDLFKLERSKLEAAAKEESEEAAEKLAKSQESFEQKLSEYEVSLKKVENERDALERQVAGKDAIVEKLESRCRTLEKEASQRSTQVEKLEASRNSLENQLWDREAAVDKLEAEARCASGLRENDETDPDNVEDQAGGPGIGILREERDLLRKEVEHRRAAAELYEAELRSMHGVIDDLRLATGEQERLIQSSENEARRLQSQLDQLRAALHTREMRISQLEGRVAAAVTRPSNGNCGVSNSDESVGSEDFATRIVKNSRHEEQASLKAMQALLASANGEIDQMSRELEAMYRAQFAREKELEYLREAVSLRDEKIRKKDRVIEETRAVKGKCLKCGQGFVPVFKGDSSPLRSSKRDSVEGNTGFGNDETGFESTEVTKSGDGILRRSEQELRTEEDLVQATLQELHEGMVVTQDKLRDVRSLARQYKSLAQSHLDVLPALYEVEGELERICGLVRKRKLGDWSTVAEQRISCVRGVVQSVIAQYYTNVQKRCVMRTVDDARYVPSPKRLAALQATVRRMRKIRVTTSGSTPDATAAKPVAGTIGLDKTEFATRRRITFD